MNDQDDWAAKTCDTIGVIAMYAFLFLGMIIVIVGNPFPGIVLTAFVVRYCIRTIQHKVRS